MYKREEIKHKGKVHDVYYQTGGEEEERDISEYDAVDVMRILTDLQHDGINFLDIRFSYVNSYGDYCCVLKYPRKLSDEQIEENRKGAISRVKLSYDSRIEEAKRLLEEVGE